MKPKNHHRQLTLTKANRRTIHAVNMTKGYYTHTDMTIATI